MSTAWAVSRATAAMREHDEALGIVGHGELAGEAHSSGGQSDVALSLRPVAARRIMHNHRFCRICLTSLRPTCLFGFGYRIARQEPGMYRVRESWRGTGSGEGERDVA